MLVTDKAVYFDGRELPWHIAEDGISFQPSNNGLHTLTVEFLVETATFKSQWEINHDGEWAWLKRTVDLEMRVQTRAFDRIMKEYK
ncbi:hypothetical protein [Mycobacterium phage SWU1]|uniref:Uncharacterized protein n=1 Tax=Mycobacterium phage SWU1 TaxID=1175504 RepID=I1V1H0_9CAUD|nr:hypothetical protein A321_gp58 [Mycobacterium phage SWU1]AFI24948.1 hypothetical protein [Mycobacterium phage SWU1]